MGPLKVWEAHPAGNTNSRRHASRSPTERRERGRRAAIVGRLIGIAAATTYTGMYQRGQTVRVLWHDDDQWYDAVFLDYVGSKCRVLWEEVEPGQLPTALVDPDDVKER